MDQEGFKKASRRLVVELVIVIAFVSYRVGFPKGESSAQNWEFVFTHLPLLFHIIVGTIILVEAFILLARSLRSKNHFWSIWAFVGLGFVLLAFASGYGYVAAPSSVAANSMSLGWFGALVTYGFGWYWGRKKAREQTGQEHV